MVCVPLLIYLVWMCYFRIHPEAFIVQCSLYFHMSSTLECLQFCSLISCINTVMYFSHDSCAGCEDLLTPASVAEATMKVLINCLSSMPAGLFYSHL